MDVNTFGFVLSVDSLVGYGETDCNAGVYKMRTLRTRVWRAIRIRQNFSIPELVGLVANGSEKDAESNIGKYLRVLESAGYLIRMRKRLRGTAMTSNGFARWRLDLEKDTGPQAPVWRRGKDTVPGHPDSYHKMANEFEDVSCALASLGELIKRADEDRLEEFTFSGIGFLLDILGKHLMNNCFEALDMASEARKLQELNQSTGLSKGVEENQSRV